MSNPVIVPAPYNNSDSCAFVRLEKNGVVKLATFPRNAIRANSPVRPLCFSIPVTTAGKLINDLIISSLQPTTVKFSAYVIIDSTILPTGFNILNFTGSSSTNGQLYQGFQIETSPLIPGNIISITLPQISVANILGLLSVDSIAVLRFDPSTAQMSSLKPAAWSQDTSLPLALQLKVSLPGPGYYFFGIFKVGEVLPIASNQWVDYSLGYNNMKTVVDGGNLQLTFVASQSTRYAVMKPPKINWVPDGYNVIDTFILTGDYITDKSVSANVSLLYKSSKENVYWRYHPD